MTATAAVVTVALFVSTGCGSHGPAPSAASKTSPSTAAAPSPTATATALPAGVIASFYTDLGAAPASVGAGFGSVWVVAHRSSVLYRINPRTNKVLAAINTDNCCAPPVAAAGYIWCGDMLVDPTTNRVTRSVRDGWVFAVVNGAPWALTSTGIAGYDPKTLKETHRFTVNANPAKVSQPDVAATYGDHFFWAVNYGEDAGYGGAIAKIDPITGKTVALYRTPDVGDQPDIEFADHAVWLHGDGKNLLVRLDARTGAIRSYQLPDFQPLSSLYPQAIAVAFGDLWIRVRSDKVIRFRPATGKVVASYPADPNGNGGLPYVAFGSLWVANFDTDTVWRDRI